MITYSSFWFSIEVVPKILRWAGSPLPAPSLRRYATASLQSRCVEGPCTAAPRDEPQSPTPAPGRVLAAGASCCRPGKVTEERREKTGPSAEPRVCARAPSPPDARPPHPARDRYGKKEIRVPACPSAPPRGAGRPPRYRRRRPPRLASGCSAWRRRAGCWGCRPARGG